VVSVVAAALAGVRKAKSDAKVSMRADVESATVTAPAEQVPLVEAARSDLGEAGRIASLTVVGRGRPAHRGRRPRPTRGRGLSARAQH
jgi:valyl-tRNA synthetase